MSYQHDWKPTVDEAPTYSCKQCGSLNVWYRTWESSCGGYEDIEYHCRNCDQKWWHESSDA